MHFYSHSFWIQLLNSSLVHLCHPTHVHSSQLPTALIFTMSSLFPHLALLSTSRCEERGGQKKNSNNGIKASLPRSPIQKASVCSDIIPVRHYSFHVLSSIQVLFCKIWSFLCYNKLNYCNVSFSNLISPPIFSIPGNGMNKLFTNYHCPSWVQLMVFRSVYCLLWILPDDGLLNDSKWQIYDMITIMVKKMIKRLR